MMHSMECILSSDADGSDRTTTLATLFDDLVRLETELWDLADVELRRSHDLPLTWFEPMRVVERTPDCRVVDIADALSITVGGTSKLVDRIAAAGLLVRSPHPDDGRSSIVGLTGDGERRLGAAARTFDRTLHRLLGDAVPADDLDLLAAALRRLRHQLHDRPGSTPP